MKITRFCRSIESPNQFARASSKLRHGIIFAGIAGVLLVGCGKEEPTESYKAPKQSDERPVSALQSAAQPESAGQVAGKITGGISWTPPTDWVEQPGRPMRLASWKIGDRPEASEVIVSQLQAGGFGGTLDNVNRWRNMVGLLPLDNESQIRPESMTVGSATATVYDFIGEGAAAKRVRVVMLSPPGSEMVTFFRLQGEVSQVEAQQKAFDAFVMGIKF